MQANERNTPEENVIKYDPIVFVNTPIRNEQQDAVGISAQGKQVEAAIDEGASMVGIVGTFGTGKSSLIDVISNTREYRDVIIVNMWDCLGDDSNASDSDVNLLTKSFLSQLATKSAASDSSFAFSRYINRRLSKNYGLFSFATSKPSIWVKAIVSFLFFVVYKALEIISPNYTVLDDGNLVSMNHFPVWMAYTAPFVAVLALAACIIFAVLAIKDAVIVYSLGKDNKTESTEINDIFDVYTDIVEYLCSGKRKKKRKNHNESQSQEQQKDIINKSLIIVEDLDRIDNKNIVEAFLRELYRFQNLVGPSRKKQVVFIVSVKPESLLIKETITINHSGSSKDGSESAKDGSSVANPSDPEPEVFSKLFDYTISLMPVHFEDYKSVVIKIIRSEPNKKDRLKKIFQQAKEEIVETDFETTLPNTFLWLIKGQSLSIRDLKDRLNKALSLFISLHNKNYKGTGRIRFESCAAVAYLQTQHERCFYKSLAHEEELSNVVRSSYRIQNAEGDELSGERKKLDVIIRKWIFDKNQSENAPSEIDSFSSDLIDMVYAGVFDDDFRMYLYSYPKESTILNSDEKDLKNLILIPTRNNDYTDLAQKIDSVIGKTEDYSTANIIMDSICNIPENAPFPYVLLINNRLFNYAIETNIDKALQALAIACRKMSQTESKDTEVQGNIPAHPWPAQTLLSQVQGYVLDEKTDRHTLYSRFSHYFRLILETWDISNYLLARYIVLETFGDDYIEDIKSLYMPSSTSNHIPPIISEREAAIITDVELFLSVTNSDLITDQNIHYITEKIVSTQKIPPAKKDAIIKATVAIFTDAQKSVSAESMALCLYKFMRKYKYANSKFMSIVSETKNADQDHVITNDDMAKYTNLVGRSKLSNTYLEAIDSRLITEGLSSKVLDALKENGYYKSLLLNLHSVNNLSSISFLDQNVQEKVLGAIDSLIVIDSSILPDIRYAIIAQGIETAQAYKKIFLQPYAAITDKELNAFSKSDFIASLSLIDISSLKADNSLILSSYCNKYAHSPEETYAFLQFLGGYGGSAPDVVNNIFYNIDMSKMPFSQLDANPKVNVVTTLTTSLRLSETSCAIRFMKYVNELIPSLEKVVQANPQDYIDLVNQIGRPSSESIQWLAKQQIIWPLAASITDILLEEKQLPAYVAGKTLREQSFIYESAVISDDIYITLFNTNSSVQTYMLKNRDFMEHLIESDQYNSLSASNLLSLVAYPQTSGLFKKIVAATSGAARDDYLAQMKPFKNIEESQEVSKFIVNGGTQNCFGSKEVRVAFLSKLKGKDAKEQFSEYMNQKFTNDKM